MSLGFKFFLQRSDYSVFRLNLILKPQYLSIYLGKLRFKKEYPTAMAPSEIQADVVQAPEAQKWLDGKAPKKVIVVPGKIINIVI